MSAQAGVLVVAGERWQLSSALNMDTVADVLEASQELPWPEAGIIDLASVDMVDSAAVAILLAWKRRALANRKPLTLANVPASLASLADLYGVDDLLAQDAGG